MKRHAMDLLKDVLFESASWLHVNPARSWITIQQRVEHEGESFLTITLPSLESHLLSCIESGEWAPNRSWKHDRKGSPVFLQEFLGLVFDFKGLSPRVKNSPDAILAFRCLRQILGLFAKKFELPSPKRSASAVERFFTVERELRTLRNQIRNQLDRDFRITTEILFGEVFSRSQKDLENLFFKHGPGMTADGAYGIHKYDSVKATWTQRLDSVFDVGQVAYLNYSDFALNGDHVCLSPKDEIPMKIVLVPKTAKTPRIIAMEPTSMQWVQQGLLQSLSFNVISSKLAWRCSWDTQDRNREYARRASKTSSHATLDLSDASDRLHVSVVAFMLKNYPLLRRSVFACRTTRASFQGRETRLEKFAPMGSAMCFAFESIAFFAISVLGIARSRRGDKRIRAVDILQSARDLSVYGDDIIVPTDSASSVMDLLEAFGLKVNRRKSFWTGKFRESCGGDFFCGQDVSISRVRRDLSFNAREQGESFASTVVLQNQLFESCYFSTAEKLANSLRRAGVATADPGLREGLWIHDYGRNQSDHTRVNTYLQRLEYKTLVPVFSQGRGQVPQESLLFHWFNTSRYGISEREVLPLARRPQLIRLRRSYIPA